MSWLRLDASAFHDRAIRRAGSHGRRAFIAALMLSRERDWRKDDKPGWLPASEFDALEVALHWGEKDTTANVAAYAKAIETLSEEGGPFRPDGDGWWLGGWSKYQPDPSALIRKRRERAAKFKELSAESHSDKTEAVEAKDSHVTAGHSDNRDVTPRNGTVRTRVRDGTERTRTRVRNPTGEREPRGSAAVGEPTSPRGESEHIAAIISQLKLVPPATAKENKA